METTLRPGRNSRGFVIDQRHLRGVQLRYNYRVYPTLSQRTALAQAFGCARVVFNDCIRLRQESWAGGVKVSDTDVQKRVVTAAKATPERAWLSGVSSVVLVQACQDARVAYRNFFDSLSGKRKGRTLGAPRFRSRKDSRQAIRFTRNGFSLRPNGKLYAAKIGELKVAWSRELPSEPSSVPTASSERVSTRVGDSSIMTFVDGAGPALVILPSYGRDGGEDYDDITARAVGDRWRVLRPQSRGVLGSVGPMAGVTLRDLAHDVAGVIGALVDGPVVVVGHAFGSLLSRMVTTGHPDFVKAVALVASQAREVPERIAQAPFIVGDPTRPTFERRVVLQEVFFAPGNDAEVWLDGWYPETPAVQRAAIGGVPLREYWTCGSVPLLEVTPEHDFGGRVTTGMVADAGHALFPERPEAAADAILSWARRFR